MILSIINQKGGVGKTTSSINLAAGLASNSKKTLIIDMDPQAHSTFACNIDKPQHTISHILEGASNISDSAIKITPYLSIVPSSIRLSVTSERLYSEAFREEILRTQLETIRDDYDYIIIDSPPTLGVLVNNIIYSSDFIIIPCEISIYSLEGMGDLITTIKKIKRNPNFNNFRVLITKYDTRNKTSNNHIMSEINTLKMDTFKTYIPRNEALNQASMAGKNIFEFDPKSKGADSYHNLTQELLKI